MKNDTFPLSHPQQRIMYTERLFPKTSFANNTCIFWFTARLEKDLLEKALEEIIARHDAFRLRMTETEDEKEAVRQFVTSDCSARLQSVRVKNRENCLAWARLRAREPFALYGSPLYRFCLIETEEGENALMAQLHHLIVDGWTLNWLAHEVNRVYHALREKLAEAKKPAFSYLQYLEREREYEASDVYLQDRDYWLEKYAVLPEEIKLHFNKQKPGSLGCGREEFPLAPELEKMMKQACRTQRTTLFRQFIAVVAAYVWRISGNSEMVLGVPYHGRANSQATETAGMFVRTLALRLAIENGQSFAGLLKLLNAEMKAAIEHSAYPYEELVFELKERNGHQADLISVNVSEMVPQDTDEVSFWNIEPEHDPSPLNLYLEKQSASAGGALRIIAVYQQDLFSAAEVRAMLDRLNVLLASALQEPECELRNLNLLPPEEKRLLLENFNETKTGYDLETTIHALFESQAVKDPDKAAVVFKGETLSYRELNEKANFLAGILAKKGVGPDQIVGVLLNRCLDMLVAPLAILKAGGAYLPIDPAYPDDRIAYMLEDSGAALLISQPELRSKSEAFGGERLDLAICNAYQGGETNLEAGATAKNLVYVIYTSGSTGKPKGVLIEHRALVNLCAWQNEYHQVTAKDSTALYSGFGFDACVWEIFPFLTAGATVHIIPEEMRLSPLQVHEYFTAQKITIADLPTQFCEQFMEVAEESALRRLITGGDKLKSYRLGNYSLTNEYGPTEYTISATAFEVDRFYDNIPIGKPLANTRIYILDRHGNLQPPGVPGELCIAGAQLARGYLNRPELTAEKFVSDPFCPGEKMYRTGDSARWLADGNIEFLGRIDYQVKIRGFRIELGEIEQQIMRHAKVRDVAVIDRDDKDGNKYLCAYLVTHETVDEEELKLFLAADLPEYMIPPYLVELEALPLTANGKVDRKALPEPQLKARGTAAYAAPRNELEEQLVEVWQEILSLGRIGIDDNFFELGGHSLKAGILQARLQKRCGVRIALSEIFKLPTIRRLAERIGGEKSGSAAGFMTVAADDAYPVSLAQKAMYLLHQAGDVGASYHVAIANRIFGPLDAMRLESALNEVVARHEALRTSFLFQDGEIMQRIVPNQELKLSILQGEAGADEARIMALLRQGGLGTEFRLEEAPLLRVILLKLREDEHIFLMEAHHIIFDGMSLEFFFDDLAAAYDGMELKPLAFQYKDYAAWHNRFLASPAIREQEDFWLNEMAGELPVLQLTADYQRPARQSFAGDRIELKLPATLFDKLKKLAEEQQASLYMVLLTAYYALLARYTGQDDIIVGAPSAGRNHPDAAGLIGVFVNTLPLRAYPSPEKTFLQLLGEVRETVLGAMDRQDYPLQLLMEKKGVRRDPSRNPLFDTMFVMQNAGSSDFHSKELQGRFWALQGDNAQVDLTLEAEEREASLELVVEYCVSLYRRDSVERLVGHYLSVLEEICAKPQSEISQLALLSESERQRLLLEFNRTAAAYPLEKTVHQLFAEAAVARPQKTALVYKEQSYTYGELNERAESLAQTLRRNGLGPDRIAALLLERSELFVIAALAVMKAGGAYLPIDPAYPDERISYMLEDSGAVLLLTQESLAAKAQGFAGKSIDAAAEENYPAEQATDGPAASSHNLAYVIYTSGSTGKPKGVMIEHRSLVNLCCWQNDYHQVKAEDRAAAYSGFGFDASLWEIFPFITCGAELHIIGEDLRLSPEELNRYFEAKGITITNLPTQFCEQFMELTENKSLKTLVTGGDKLRNFTPQNYRLVNEYGPTEYTISATAFLLDRGYENIPIGKPLANTWLYVLDGRMRLQPQGVPGELCIAGVQLARGYLNRPELTAEKFVANPYATGEENARLYRTGDLVRWLPDGNLEFLGRIDQQVKIRGYRIELGEIEQQLLHHPEVKDVIVIDRSSKEGTKYLCAYFSAEHELSAAMLQSFLARELPDYMVPACFVQLAAIPLTANGKIDRQALPEPDFSGANTDEYLAPRDATEECLARVWQEVLGCGKVGVNDNFFHLGGDSIKAIQVISRLGREHIKLEMKQLFKYPRIGELSAQVRRLEKTENREAVSGETLLTPIQEWFFAAGFAQPQHWNQSNLLYAANGLEPQLTAQALGKVVEHHDALRMTYRVVEGRVRQYNRKNDEGEMFTLTVRQASADEAAREIAELEGEKLQRSFDLASGPLLKAALVQKDGAAYLALVAHHLVVDSLSWEIILEDFTTAYQQAEKGEKLVLPPKTDSYQSWAKGLAEYAKSSALLRELPYWQKIEAQSVPPLPVDYPQAGASSIADEEQATLAFAAQWTQERLQQANKAYRTETEDLLLAGLGLALREWAEVQRIAVTLEGHGREELQKGSDVSRTVGWFTAAYPLLIETKAQAELGFTLKSVKESIRRIPNKGAGYEILCRLTPKDLKPGFVRRLQPEIEFNYMGQVDGAGSENGLFSIAAIEAGRDVSLDSLRDFRLIISGGIMNGALEIAVAYSRKDYAQETIARLLECYEHALKALVEHCVNLPETEATPSDLGDASLTLAELDGLRNRYGKNIQAVYPLSPMQQGMLFIALSQKDSEAYFEQSLFDVRGALDDKKLEAHLNAIVKKHDVLRTAFSYEGVVRQVVLGERPLKLQYEDLSQYEAAQQQAIVERRQIEARRQCFRLDTDPLLRLALYKTGENAHTALLSFHHIIMDGWGMGIIAQELFGEYGQELTKCKAPYHSYIEWLNRQDQDEAKTYWRQYLNGCDSATVLPQVQNTADAYRPADSVLFLERTLTARLQEIAREQQVTLNIILQAVWGLLLQCYNNRTDIVFGSVVSGRTPEVEGVEDMVGLFINTIPVRVCCAPEMSFAQLLQQLQSDSLASERYDYLPLAEIQAQSALKNSLISHLIAFQNLPEVEAGEIAKSGLEVSEIGGFDQISYPFGLAIVPAAELEIRFSYNASAIKAVFIAEMQEQLLTVLEQIAAEPQIAIKRIEILPERQRRILLEAFCGERLAQPDFLTANAGFEKMAQLYPQKTALVYKERSYTYAELNEKTNRLANLLRAKGIGPNDVAAIMVERGAEIVIGSLAVMKAGGAYLPIDPAYPKERIEYLLKDSSAKLLLTQASLQEKGGAYLGEKLLMDDPVNYEATGENLEPLNQGTDLAYLIYTSGSTGQPKGVQIEQRNLINLCRWQLHFHNVASDDKAAAYSGFGFDASIWEMYPFLLCGAEVHILPDEVRLAPLELNSYFEANGITITNLPTQLCEQFMEMTENKSLKTLVTGGDKLKYYRQQGYRLINEYGPTEYTISATAFAVDKRYENIPIGKPLANTWAYVLDRQERLQPVGVPGELCLAGAQLARGYHQRPELTAEKFVANPFALGAENDRLYKSGDLVRWLPDGNLEFLGRIDQQVKIRGYRIELGEIEQRLKQHQLVQDNVVIDREDAAGGKYLCAYVVAKAGATAQELNAFLGAELPSYMLPLYYVFLDQIPLNANGKIERRALPEPVLRNREYAAPRNEIEAQLVQVWQEVLGVSEIGAEDDFFALGGHSLKVTSLLAKIQKAFAVTLEYEEVFAEPTVRGLSRLVAGRKKSASEPIISCGGREYYPLSSKQKRIFVMEQMSGIGTAYHITSAFRLQGYLDKARMSLALDEMLRRHEILRSGISIVDGEPLQQVMGKVNLKKPLRQVKAEEISARLEEFARRFDLAKPPLVRLELLEISAQEHILLLDVHHIIFDGISLEIFLRELMAIYQGKMLPEPKLQYGDFAVWEEQRLQSPALKMQESYWTDAFAGELPVLNLPLDYQRPAVRGYEGAVFEFALDSETSRALQEMAEREQATLFMLLLAAYNVLLHKYSGQEDIIVGTPSSGRTHAELDEMIGMFVSTLPCRSYPSKAKSFKTFLGEVRRNCLDMLNNQEFPFEMLLERLNIKRDPSRNPLFDVMFSFNGQAEEAQAESAELKLRPYEGGAAAAQFDLTLEAAKDGDSISLAFEYSTALFGSETIERMSGHFLNLLREIAANEDVLLKDASLLSAAEEEALLNGFGNAVSLHSAQHTVQELFERSVKKYPDRIALVFKGQSYTYRELDRKTNRLARLLRSKGLGRDERAVIMVNRSAEIMIAILAVLKAGGAYVPIDPGYAAERIAYMLEDCGAKFVLSQKELRAKCRSFDGAWIDLHAPESYQENAAALELLNEPGDLAYIIYTSGSTGNPKGVMIEHRNLVNLCQWHQDYHQVTSEDNAAAYSGFGFDASVWEMMPFITCGATLHIIAEELRLSPLELNAYFETQRITITNLPTQFCEQFIALVDNSSLRTLVTGGDKLKSYRPRKYKLINEYGPTECTVSATVFEVDREYANIPIGKALSDTWLYVLDEELRLQPQGVAGELCIAGNQVARGYLNRPELTAEKFVPNPFARSEKNAVIYKTGDLVRWLPDGNLEFLGRIDQQVKIRGYRIELGEIEQQILRHEKIKDAVVLEAFDQSGGNYLAAYLVLREAGLSVEALKEFLLRYLPEYMLPSCFVEVASIPLTANGKIDRRALPAPEYECGAAKNKTEHQAAANQREAQMLKVWCEVLGKADIGVADNFFQIGGNSIKAITVTAKLQPYFEININQIFEHQTVRALAANCKSKENKLKARLAELKARAAQAEVPLSESAAKAVTAKEDAYRRNIAAYEQIDLNGQKEYQKVLLTGATGYLGCHLLRELFVFSDAAIVLPVRGATHEAAQQRLAEKMSYYFGAELAGQVLASKRIAVLPADLREERLGLSEAAYEQLAASVDCIINSAANVRHYGHYDEFWRSNVETTLQLLAFAGTGMAKDFHQISTISVSEGSIAGVEAAVFSEYETDIGQVSENHYLKTKLEAEKAVLKAREKGINANIYRVGNIVFQSDSGVYQENIEENAFYLQVKAFVNLGVVPEGTEVEFSFVDQLAAAIVRLACCPALQSETHHLYNTRAVLLDEVLTDAALKMQVKALPYGQFIDYLERHYEKPGFQNHIEQIMLHFGWLDDADEAAAVRAEPRVLLWAEKTEYLLKKLGFAWAELKHASLKKMLFKALQERSAALRQTAVFAGLAEAEAAELAAQSELRLYDDESSIIWEGEANDKVYLLIDGFAEISRSSAGGWAGTLRIAGGNDFIGEESLFGEANAAVTAEAMMGDAVALAIPSGVLQEMMQKNPALAFGLLQALHKRVRRLEKLVVSLG